jgi:hypothetical protein
VDRRTGPVVAGIVDPDEEVLVADDERREMG